MSGWPSIVGRVVIWILPQELCNGLIGFARLLLDMKFILKESAEAKCV